MKVGTSFFFFYLNCNRLKTTPSCTKPSCSPRRGTFSAFKSVSSSPLLVHTKLGNICFVESPPVVISVTWDLCFFWIRNSIFDQIVFLFFLIHLDCRLNHIHVAPPLSADGEARELRVSLTPNTEEDRGSPENRRAQEWIKCDKTDKLTFSWTMSKGVKTLNL